MARRDRQIAVEARSRFMAWLSGRHPGRSAGPRWAAARIILLATNERASPGDAGVFPQAAAEARPRASARPAGVGPPPKAYAAGSAPRQPRDLRADHAAQRPVLTHLVDLLERAVEADERAGRLLEVCVGELQDDEK